MPSSLAAEQYMYFKKTSNLLTFIIQPNYSYGSSTRLRLTEYDNYQENNYT